MFIWTLSSKDAESQVDANAGHPLRFLLCFRRQCLQHLSVFITRSLVCKQGSGLIKCHRDSVREGTNNLRARCQTMFHIYWWMHPDVSKEQPNHGKGILKKKKTTCVWLRNKKGIVLRQRRCERLTGTLVWWVWTWLQVLNHKPPLSQKGMNELLLPWFLILYPDIFFLIVVEIRVNEITVLPQSS